ncbi:MAG: KH domain-containing protein [Candidatus Methanomethyliaceae archaeon]|nr:KH domain-containing protein [Candidatus Methanomethyliaceae archaeon]MDW7970308.1 KH domain-containing protein [Nitrososphaerota archaeon]
MVKELTNRMYLKIPLERVGVVIGEKGEVKSEIENRTNTIITIDGKSGEVIIENAPNTEDPSGILKARDVVNAIARGFSPERAFRLFDDNQVLDIVNLKELLGDSKNHIMRIKGRIIGERGNTRKIIEELTNTYISIYGHTVSIIGDYDEVRIAREAIEMLIKGMQHGTVYRFLDRKHSELKRRALSLWEERFELREDSK